MFASLGMDTLILCVGLGSGALGLGLGGYMIRRARMIPAPKPARVEEIVRSAPYDRLHNVLKVAPRK